MTSRRYTRLQGSEREAAQTLAVSLYVSEGLSIASIVAEFSQRERPVSFGTVHRLLHEAQVELRPSGGSAARRAKTPELTQ